MTPAGQKPAMTSSWLPTFQLPTNLPREQKLSYIEQQKRKLTEYIAFLDAQAAEHEEDSHRPSNRSYPSALGGGFPSSSARRASPPESPLPPNFAEEGFEAVTPDDLSEVLATGVKVLERPVQRGWFAWRSVSAPVPKPPTPQPASAVD